MTHVETTKTSERRRLVKLVSTYSDNEVVFSYHKSYFSLSNLEE